jgi:hypothetical protein
MNTTITQMAAEVHRVDLLREAARQRQGASVARRARRLFGRRPRLSGRRARVATA